MTRSESQERSPIIGIISIIAALQILPFSDIMAKYLSLSMPVIEVIWGRFFFHFIITGIFVAIIYGKKYVLPDLSKIVLFRSAALFCAVGLFYVTIHHLPLTTSLTLWFIEPFILTLMAAFIAKERINKTQWFAIFAGFLGILIAIRPTVVAWDWAYLIGIAAGFFYALFLFLTRYVDNKVPAIVSVYHTGLVGCILATIITVPQWVNPSSFEWILLIGAGGVAAIAHFFIIKSFELASAGVLAPFTYTEIITGAILGYLMFNDVPDIWLLTGLAIIIASGIAVAKSKKSNNKTRV